MKQDKDIREELSSLTPGFSWPEKAPVYSVPEGYFDRLPAQVINRIHEKEPVAIFEKTPRLWQGSFFLKKLAIAASMALLVVAGSLLWRYFDQQRRMEDQLSSLSNNAIKTYLNMQSGIFDGSPIYNISNISDQDLKALIKEVSETEFIRK